MRIKVKDKSIHFTLHLPLALIKCRLIYKSLIKKYSDGGEIDKDKCDINDEKKMKFSPEQLKLPKYCYNLLKEYKREYGGLKIVDVKSADGTTVEITV